MSDEEHPTKENFKDKRLEVLRMEEAGIRARIQKIFDISQSINSKIVVKSQSFVKLADGIKEKADIWLKGVQDYYVKKDRKMSEILDFEKDDKKINALEADLLLISGGFDERGYNSPIGLMKEAETVLQRDLEKQKDELKKEAGKREKLEEELQEKKKRLEEIEPKLGTAESKLKQIEKSLKEGVEKEMGTAGGYVDLIFNMNFYNFFLREISKLGIPDINFQWDDEGISYIFSSNFYEMQRNREFRNIIDAKTKGKEIKVSDMRIREQHDEIVKGLANYVRDNNHANNVRALRSSLSKAKNALALRKSKELYWCGDYSKSCTFVCPGFSTNEHYCSSAKNTPYNAERLNLINRVIENIDVTLQEAVALETLIRRKY